MVEDDGDGDFWEEDDVHEDDAGDFPSIWFYAGRSIEYDRDNGCYHVDGIVHDADGFRRSFFDEYCAMEYIEYLNENKM